MLNRPSKEPSQFVSRPLVRSTALNAGASAFLTKPFDDEELFTAIRLALAPAT
jgi:DNA-binding response OmpR family regulator